MKHLPNILTVGNLFCGCMAIFYILFSSTYYIESGETQYEAIENSTFFLGALFIGVAGLCDFLDGFAARLLGVESAIGKDLDSLADVVSFGVAPSMILAKMLWAGTMCQTNALNTSTLTVAPAFLVACFGCVRLARFNNAAKNNEQFTGVPIPAIGILIAGIGLMYYYNSLNLGNFLHNKWFLYAVIIFCCWAMLSKLKIFTLKIKNFNFAENWGRFLWIALTIACIPFLKFATLPVSVFLYIIISFFYTPKSYTTNVNN